MKLILQRVKKATVSVENKVCGECGIGFCILAGMEPADTVEDIQKMAQKIATLRVFADENIIYFPKTEARYVRFDVLTTVGKYSENPDYSNANVAIGNLTIFE